MENQWAQLAQLAGDPQTSQQLLYELAVAYPHLHGVIIQNPNCYPELVAWMQAYPAPAVEAADTLSAASPLANAAPEQVAAVVPEVVQPAVTPAVTPVAASAVAPVAKGLSAGAIAGIVAGVVVVGGLTLGFTGVLPLKGIPGMQVSVEQGCQNLEQGFYEVVAKGSSRVEALDDEDYSDFDDIMGMFTNEMGNMLGDMRSLTKSVHNKEVEAAWTNYLDRLQEGMDFSEAWLFGGEEFDEDEFWELNAREMEANARVMELCPNIAELLDSGF